MRKYPRPGLTFNENCPNKKLITRQNEQKPLTTSTSTKTSFHITTWNTNDCKRKNTQQQSSKCGSANLKPQKSSTLRYKRFCTAHTWSSPTTCCLRNSGTLTKSIAASLSVSNCSKTNKKNGSQMGSITGATICATLTVTLSGTKSSISTNTMRKSKTVSTQRLICMPIKSLEKNTRL